MKRFNLWLSAIALASLTGAPSASAAPTTIKVGLSVTEQHYEFHAMQKFEAYVEEQTNGELQVELYSHTLGNDSEVLEAIKINAAQMNVPAPSVLGGYAKEMRLLELLYVFPDEETASRVADGPWGQKLLETLDPAGFTGLAITNFGFRQISNDIRPIEKLSDLKGLKMRVMQNKATLEAFRALGTNPTPMAFSEVFSALQLGTVDGQEGPYTNTYQERFNEVQKYVSDSAHAYSWAVILIGKKFFAGLPPEQQQIIRDGSRIAVLHMRDAAAKQDAESLQKMIDGGITFTPIPEETRQAIKDAVRPAVEASGKDISESMYQELLEAVEAAQAR
ncbi:MAG: TRAP transporter substrate-binding protein [Tropicimonas sp.]|uniref:TRAP transporter substrate-binding protein n=1 Tax=Tropicimonas sp. TaxID=2067044 RepID=UPI003A8BDCC1